MLWPNQPKETGAGCTQPIANKWPRPSACPVVALLANEGLQSCLAMTECIFGWGKQRGTIRKTKDRGIAAMAADFLLNFTAYTLIRGSVQNLSHI